MANEVIFFFQISKGKSRVFNAAVNLPLGSDAEPPSNSNSDFVRGICPSGWHLPSVEELNVMVEAAGVVQRTGTSGTALGSGAGKLATGCYWKPKSTTGSPGDYDYGERNSSGFSAIPAGTFNNSQDRYYASEYTYFWTSTQDNTDTANKKGIRYRINYDWAGPKPDSNNKFLGGSVRCVRDAE